MEPQTKECHGKRICGRYGGFILKPIADFIGADGTIKETCNKCRDSCNKSSLTRSKEAIQRANKNYSQTEQGIIANKNARKKYEQTEKFNVVLEKYHKTDKYKASVKVRNQRAREKKKKEKLNQQDQTDSDTDNEIPD